MPAQDLGELFDLCDRDGALLGAAKPRGEVHRDGDWHRSVHVWVVLREGSGVPGAARAPGLLFQRRSPEKDTWPGALDVAVTGHLRAGEAILDGLREAREEIGIEIAPADVVLLGTRRCVEDRAGLHDREIQTIFAAATSRSLADFRPDPEEVSSLVAVDLDDAAALFRGERAEVPAVELRYDERAPAAITVRASDFVAEAGEYYAASARSLGAWLQGRAEAAWPLD